MSPSPDTAATGAVVKRNDYAAVRPAEGDWRPSRTVSVIVPAYGEQDKLDLTLAALAAQTYPAELTDVVVADDGSEPPLRLPEIRPERTRIVPTADGAWGIAAAVNTAVRACEGDVVLRLDSDVIPAAGHVEAHLRWHHAVDYAVVLGKLSFVDLDADRLHPLKVRDAVAADRAEDLFEGLDYSEDWQIGLIAESEGRIDDEVRAFITANGATISFPRAMYDEVGGLDQGMPLGSDTEFGYRLAQAGAVFVPEARARAWHLGLSQMKSARKQAGTRFRHQFMAGRVPSLRYLRNKPGLQWKNPYVEVVVDTADAKLEHVRTTLSSVFGGSLPDAAVTLVGPWSALTGERVRPLDDPMLEARLVREAFGGDPRVTYRDSGVHGTDESGAVPFRVSLRAGTVFGFDGLARLIAHADTERLGRLALVGADGTESVLLERTAAVSRALRLGLGADAEAIEKVWGAATERPERWMRAAPGMDAAINLAARRQELNFARAQLRAEQQRQRSALKRLRRFAGRVKRGLGRRIRRN